MEATDTRVLAQYDFRTKQKYIFRTNKMREIIGASALITCMYDVFIDELQKNGIKVEKYYKFPKRREDMDSKASVFSYGIVKATELQYVNKAEIAFDPVFSKEAKTQGKVLYVGGGNLYILWKDEDTAQMVTAILCELLRKHAYSLFPACATVKYTGNYLNDIHDLSNAFNRNKELVPPFEPIAVLPFTRVDRKTSFPVAGESNDGEYLPMECLLKRKAYDALFNNSDIQTDVLGEIELENISTGASDNLLAVIHIDGNNMGRRVSAHMDKHDNYEDAVSRIREFSNAIQEIFVTKPLDAIRKLLEVKSKEDEKCHKARVIVAGGDDVTLVCSAYDALDIVNAYFESIRDSNADQTYKNFGYNSATAGVCIFHSHSPFATAYEIAEACCDEAKKKNRAHGGDNMMMDFQFCFSGVTGSLSDIRSIDCGFMARPYCFTGPDVDESAQNGIRNITELTAVCDTIKKKFQKDSDGMRGYLKRLSQLLIIGDIHEFELELYRKGLDDLLENGVKEQAQTLIFDLAQIYDLWFREQKTPQVTTDQSHTIPGEKEAQAWAI